MFAINQHIRASLGDSANEVEARDVFQLIAGTSTGGLIALMLGKMNMTVKQCIDHYYDLAKDIFGKPSIRGKLSWGLGKPRYRANSLEHCVGKLLGCQKLNAKMPMQGDMNAPHPACAVICTEHESSSHSNPEFKQQVVCICSRPCDLTVNSTVSQAARATSAAATYFPPVSIDSRTFSDGGYRHNNPSWAIFRHYSEAFSVINSRSTGPIGPDPPKFAKHGNGDLDCASSRFVNIGTGTRVDNESGPTLGRGALTQLLTPRMYSLARALNRNLIRAATDSEQTAEIMEVLSQIDSKRLQYNRLSATHQVCFFKLHDYKHLRDIEAKTADYLQEPGTRDRIEAIAVGVADDYLDRHGLRPEQPAEETRASETPTVTESESHTAINNNNTVPTLRVERSNITSSNSGGSQSSQNRQSAHTEDTSLEQVDSSVLHKDSKTRTISEPSKAVAT